MHTHPRPLTMSIVKLPSSDRVRNDPRPPSAPRRPTSATYRVADTEMPATSAASGFSPTARIRMPVPVEPSTHHSSGASTPRAT